MRTSFSARRIEIASGLIGDKKLGRLDNGARHRYALHLAAGDLMRVYRGFVPEADPVQTFHGGVLCVGRAGEQKR